MGFGFKLPITETYITYEQNKHTHSHTFTYTCDAKYREEHS